MHTRPRVSVLRRSGSPSQFLLWSHRLREQTASPAPAAVAPISKAPTLPSPVLLARRQRSGSLRPEHCRPGAQTEALHGPDCRHREQGHCAGALPEATRSHADPPTPSAPGAMRLRGDPVRRAGKRNLETALFPSSVKASRRWSTGIWWQVAPAHPWPPRPPPGRHRSNRRETR